MHCAAGDTKCTAIPFPFYETHLVTVRSLPTKKFQPKFVNKESYFVRQGLTDLLYANA